MEHELYIRCKNKDRNAQRKLYEEYAGRFFATCKRYLKNDEDAEEVLADSFYLIFTKLDQLKELQVFDAWAKKIVVNQCLQKLRKKQPFSISIEENFVDLAEAEPENVSEERGILSLLNFLPEGCRTIFNLFAMEGYPHKEIAQMLSISEGTSKSQVNFARKKLKELVQLQTINS